MKVTILPTLILSSLVAIMAPRSDALEPQVLYEFQRGPRYPEARLVEGPDGYFYGTTSSGGSGGAGTVFKVNTNGTLTTLVSFNGTNGAQPRAALALNSDGNFYGTTAWGGAGFGTVFKLATNGVLTTLVSFSGTNGARPEELLEGDGGNFYGTTFYGGAQDKGTVFRMTDNGELTTLASFNGTNGANPNGLVLARDGNIYGTTWNGGNTDWGTVFRLTTSGELTRLASFDVTNGAAASGLVLGRDGNVYGTTAIGGKRFGGGTAGTIFKVTSDGLFTTLVWFNGTNGAYPVGPLVLGNDGSFYGVTRYGGTSDSGTIFKVSTNGELTTLVSVTDPNGPVVDTHNGLILGSDGNLYGTLQEGGSSRLGTIFRVTSNGLLTTLFTFSNPLGEAPSALVLGDDGSFYGTTVAGGDSDYGTVFKLTTNPVFTTLASFDGGYGGGTRPNTLLRGNDGYIYGTPPAPNTVFKVSPNGQLTTLTSFSNTNGMESVSSLVLGKDGAFYGTTYFFSYAWASGGTVFKVTTNGEATTLVTFNGTNGAVPNALVFGKDGNLYGMTAGEVGQNVNQGTGTVFKVTPDGNLTTLLSYPWTNSPVWGRLVSGNNGNFYGTTYSGGSAGNGAVFKLTTNGVLTTMVSFNGPNGVGPLAALLLGGDGNFYGTTVGGGSNGFGTVFKMTPDGELATLVSFNGNNGAYPDNALVSGNDGNLYGTTSEGGRGGGGTIFRIVLPRLKTLVREPGGNFLLTGTGPANDSYRLWASTDLSLPFAAWTLLTSGSFDSAGNFSFTEAPTNRSRFYQLSVP